MALAHRVAEFKGERYTMVFLTNRSWNSISASHAKAAKKLGIRLPTSKTMDLCEKFLQSTGKVAHETWFQPQIFKPLAPSGKNNDSKIVVPVSENNDIVDVKLEAGVEELRRALGFKSGSGDNVRCDLDTAKEVRINDPPADINVEGGPSSLCGGRPPPCF